MADLTAFPSTSTAGSAKTGPVTNDTNIRALEQHKRDTSDPTLNQPGQVWWRSDEERFYYEDESNTKTAMMTGHTAYADLEMNGNEVNDLVLEGFATGSIPAATNTGELGRDTTRSIPYYLDGSAKRYTALTNLDGTSYWPVDIPLNEDVAVVTNATTATKNGLKGWLFDATNEEIVVVVPVPGLYTGAHDLYVRLWTQLNAAETAADDLNWSVDWETTALDSAETFGGTESTGTGTLAITGAADGSCHKVDVTIDYDDATNPVVADDLIKLTMRLTDVTDITNGVILHRAQLLVPHFVLGV